MAWLAAVGPAVATVIRLEPDVLPDMRSAAPGFDIDVVNRGDEAARAVRATVTLANVTNGMMLAREIGPGQTVSQHLGPVAIPPVAGRYMAAVSLAYTDLNGAPFSAVSLTEVDVAPAALPANRPQLQVFAAAELPGIRLARSGRLILNVIPLTDRTMDATARLILPAELTADCPVQALHLDPDVPTNLTFNLRRASALAGSQYAVFAVLDWETNGLHRSLSVSGTVAVESAFTSAVGSQVFWFCLAGLLTGLFLLAQVSRRFPAFAMHPAWLSVVVVMAAGAFILWHLSPADLLRDTTPVGGDTPAHNYLASHLRDQLFGHGRLVSWAGGWWGGFPMFQYYFVLPYLVMAILGVVLPLTIAFKLVSVTGAVLLPAAAFAMARSMRLPRPAPELLAVLMVPFLFVDTHSMWGVNLRSVLAGMIANSLSFSLMLLALGCAWRDAADGVFRVRTTALMALVVASHFFTSVMTAVVLASYPLLQIRGRRARAFAVLAGEGILAALLMAWWWLPLMATAAYSMEFGTNWPMALWKTFPPYAAALAALGALALLAALRCQGSGVRGQGSEFAGGIAAVPRGLWGTVTGWLWRCLLPEPRTLNPQPGSLSPCFALAWMMVAAGLLLRFGFALSPVFVNVRLWPFLFFALVALGGSGTAVLLARARIPGLAVLAVLACVLGGVTRTEQLPTGGGLVRTWASWNYSGLEAKDSWPTFRELVMPLRGTPGRLANDLNPDNERFGSSRIFELVPSLIGKPILEGGLVNSAAGSLFAYYIQSETSKDCAGYPPMMIPSRFDLANATRHLELFNVKHLIARWPTLQDALARSPAWRFLYRVDGWEVYELLTHQGQTVHVLEVDPVALETADWKQRALEWTYAPAALDRPVLLVPPGVPVPPGVKRISDAEFASFTRTNPAPPTATLDPPPRHPSTLPLRPVKWESVADDRITFVTDAIGRPHLIKVNWFPNWQVRGADAVYRVTPDFMLVYPRQAHVDLYYGRTAVDRAGLALTWLGWLGMIGVAGVRAWKSKR